MTFVPVETIEPTPEVKKNADGFLTKIFTPQKNSFFIFFIFFLLLAIYIVLTRFPNKLAEKLFWPAQSKAPKSGQTAFKLDKFQSEEEFKTYLESAKEVDFSAAASLFALPRVTTGFGAPGVADLGLEKEALDFQAERVSTTNVQVTGIDEPDIVKTNGKEIFFSSDLVYDYFEPMPLLRQSEPDSLPGLETGQGIGPSELMPRYNKITKIINAFPPSRLEKISELQKSGNLLLDKNILIVFEKNTVYGFDVLDPKLPEQIWSLSLEEKNILVAARLYQGKIYLILQRYIDQRRPCPIPLIGGEASVSVRCLDIYHPTTPVPTDVTFSVLAVDPKDGKIAKSTSFVGSASSSIVYMSPEAIYITYSYFENTINVFFSFYKNEVQDLLTDSAITKIKDLENLKLSLSSKFNELNVILEEHKSQLNDDQLLRYENEMNNRLQSYINKRIRDFEKSGIAKISNSGLTLLSTGVIPGQPLNQFSLDEYQGHLRVATTLSGNFMVSSQSANDLYILDKDLNISGSVKDLGLGERIYSARFIEDKGYLVTFRQTDPFYVFDLSDPKNPVKKGELKIPGFSSYLHPLGSNLILGVGMEVGKVKLSLFDVSDPANPQEVDKYNLDEYWTEVSQTHHAFLQDSQNKVFFLPGSQGGYIFSYRDNKLNLKRTISGSQIKRALYINDYLYVLGEQALAVINLQDFEEVNKIAF